MRKISAAVFFAAAMVASCLSVSGLSFMACIASPLLKLLLHGVKLHGEDLLVEFFPTGPVAALHPLRQGLFWFIANLGRLLAKC